MRGGRVDDIVNEARDVLSLLVIVKVSLKVGLKLQHVVPF